MLRLDCPFCGGRPETELECGGECRPARPLDLAQLSDEAWAAWLFNRENVKGVHDEWWLCRFGCGTWFKATRDTVTHRVIATAALEAPSTIRGPQ